ncbi:MAG: competence protein ComK [Firmicutes bacterium]|nr:competence protein ComK [Bacillota bacterium]
MIHYIEKTKEDFVKVAKEHDVFLYDRTLIGYLNELLLETLSTLEGRLKATKKVFHFKAKIPIFINESTLLIPLIGYRSKTSFYLNYHSIEHFSILKGSKLYISFRNNHEMKLEKKYGFIKQYEKAKRILDYLEKAKNE